VKVVILAGGLGTRISEETATIPKPMIEVGGKPLLWHIIKHYSHFGFNEFIICLGYKGYAIKHYFTHYHLFMSDVTLDMANNSLTYHATAAEPWRITLVDTGEETMTGGRIRRIREYVKDDEAFCLTYGDGLSNVNIKSLAEFHRAHGKMATVTAVRHAGRFGILDMAGDTVTAFREKPREGEGFINGGFFVLSPKVIDLIDNDATSWERAPLETLSARGELQAFRHEGYWHCIDTLHDKQAAQAQWDSGRAPWKLY
jgi:glucose-1-phosphate cytidylyltransferase